MKALEHPEDLFRVFLVEADAVVLDVDPAVFWAYTDGLTVQLRTDLRRDLHHRRGVFFGIFQGVADQVVEQRLDETGVDAEGGYFIYYYFAFFRFDFFIEIDEHLADKRIHVRIHKRRTVH